MEAIGYLYSLAAQDSDAAAITAQDSVDAVSAAIAPLTQDMAQAAGRVSRQALTLACSASLVLASGSAALALQRGDSGSNVTQLQQDLTAAGVYSGPVTGFYGSLTQAAVEEFQIARGLVVDGVAGPNTLAALQGSAPVTVVPTADNPNVLKRGNQGVAVTDLQRALANAGYFSGPVTGFYGSLTEGAVITFQQANGLVVDGIAGPITLAELAVDNSAPDVALVPVAQTVVTTVQPAAAATPIPAATGDVLYLGDRGQAVLSLQTTLSEIGFYNRKRLTGYYGSSTEAAVKRFQES
ncbi:MAG: peptidoglycan-binding protein, partial [Cyanobacteria bacterium P01_A01_bin.135]